MRSLSRRDVMSMAYERSLSRRRFYHHPVGWVGKWMIGGFVFGLYIAIPVALTIWYYYFFLPWRDK